MEPKSSLRLSKTAGSLSFLSHTNRSKVVNGIGEINRLSSGECVVGCGNAVLSIGLICVSLNIDLFFNTIKELTVVLPRNVARMFLLCWSLIFPRHFLFQLLCGQLDLKDLTSPNKSFKLPQKRFKWKNLERKNLK